MSSSNALNSALSEDFVGDIRPDLVTTIEQPLLGAIFRLGAPALEMAILNHVGSEDFSESGCGELFEMARQARLADQPVSLAALSRPIQAQSLADVAGACIQAASTVTLGEIPFLSQRLVCDALYRDGMRATAAFHAKLTATAETSGHPRDLLKVFETHDWAMTKLARRLKHLL